MPATLTTRLRALRKRRHASRFADVLKLGGWFFGIAAAATLAGATLIGSR